MRRLHIVLVTLVCIVLVAVASSWAAESATQQSQQLVPRAVLKLIIDHPTLAQHLHPEIAGRVPLAVSDHPLEPGVTPSKFGQPVRIVRDQEVGSQPHIRFLSFEIAGFRAKATFQYEVEGVKALFVLERSSNGWWKVIDATVAEH